MAAPPPPPPPASPTTITALGDDILREIFLRLPDVATLARAAFACPAFLHAVRSSPAFRRRFRELHAPALLALFLPLELEMPVVVPAAAGKGNNNIADAFAALLQDSDASEWRSEADIPHIYGYTFFVSRSTGQRARYNPHSKALDIYPKNFRFRTANDAFLEFLTLPPDGDEQLPYRVVCVHRDRAWTWARVAAFSAQTMEWQVVLPEMDMGQLLFEHVKPGNGAPKVVNGFVCWVDMVLGSILALNTATFQFSLMELPPTLIEPLSQLGHTNDGKFCVVSVLQCMLSVWLWAADGDGNETFMLHKTFSMRENVSKITQLSEEAGVGMRPMTVINGFVYLTAYLKRPDSHPLDDLGDPQSPEWFLSCCLETNEMNLLYKKSQLLPSLVDAEPYIMVSWPSSLINGKEDSEAGVSNISEDDGHMAREEASPVLFTALQSFKEKMIDSNSSFTEIDSFLLDDERDSLLNRIATLELGLAAARDRVLRIGTDSDSMEGMGRVSYWQMCKGMLGRACSRFFTG